MSRKKRGKVETGSSGARQAAPEIHNGISGFTLFVPRIRKPNMVVSILVSSLRMILVLILLVCFAGAGALFGIAKAYMDTTPVLDIQRIEEQSQTSFIYDADGKLITTYSGLENRMWAGTDEIPDMLQKAFIATEDVRFETHSGVDFKRLVGAFIGNIFGESSATGASTITQQLVKNRLLSSERTYKRKIQEAYLAMQLEAKYTKAEILEFYLNTIPLGETNYGVKAAAKDYFGKELSELSLRECAMLAGITQSPYSYDPRRNYYILKKPEITDNRTSTVLKRMLRAGFIGQTQYDTAISAEVAIVEKSKVNEMYDMPYFVEYAIYDVITHFLRQRNKQDTTQNRALIENELRTKGYKIYTTVDPKVQLAAEDTIINWSKYPKLKNPSDGMVITKNPDGSITEIAQPQAAAAFIDYRTGEIRAIVGGRYPPSRRKELNRAYQGRMPVGSSIKPLSVYGPAFDLGASPGNVIYNVPLPIKGWNTAKGYPSNYDSKNKSEVVTIREGIVRSLNIVAARVLLEKVGIENSKNYLIDLGINADHINADGPGLALGTSGITPIEMAAAFGCIANRGLYIEPVAFTRVVDPKGNVVLDAKAMQVRQQVFQPSTAWLLTDVLTQAVNEGTGKKAKINGMTVAGKTGTNDGYRGVVFAGMTPYYSGAVWIGHDRYKPLQNGATGGAFAAPLWRAIMAKVHEDKGLTNKAIIEDDPSLGLVRVNVCTVSGMLATTDCNSDPSGRKPRMEWFAQGNEPTQECTFHHVYNMCSGSGKIATPYCPVENVKNSSCVVVLPYDSILRLLPPDVLAQIFPSVLFAPADGADIASLTPTSSNYYDYYCNIHTEQWSKEQQLNKAKSDAQTLISTVQAEMSAHAADLTVEQQAQLTALIDSLNEALSGTDTSLIISRTSSLRQGAEDILVPLG
ncbi:MAG: PBP1A family penicillin-binding protein [Bacillota bacterium]|nr:PBP1A family penicillin-binding protein [Bacillota bacterium]